MKIEHREPNWEVWSNVPSLEVWQGVALSLNIEPRKVRFHPNGWRVDKHLFEETQKFEDRMLLADSHFREGGSLIPWRPTDLLYGIEGQVGLVTFARWARNLDWEMPVEMQALAERDDAPKTAAASTPRPNDELHPKERNQLLKLIYILADMTQPKLSDVPPRTAGSMVEAHAKNDLEMTISDKSVAEKIKEARDIFGKEGPRKIPR